MGTLPPFKLERFLYRHEFTAPYLLCSSDCEAMTVKELLDFEPTARDDFEKLWLGYTEAPGNPELRAGIASLYESISAENVLVHSGAQEAIYNFARACLSGDDHVIVHWPCYQSLFQMAETIGCAVTKWEADPTRGWELDIEFLKTAIRRNTRAIFLNLPHNPTGYWMESDRLREVASLADRHGAWLFLDEVYRGLEHAGSALPAGCDLSETAVSLGVMSKSFGLPGLRIGWIATRNRKVHEAMTVYKDYTTICNSAPSEFLTTLALRHRNRILRRNRELVLANLAAVEGFFRRHENHFAWTKPRAGCLAFPHLRGGLSAEAFCADVLESTGVLLAPSSTFSYGDGHFRLGFGRSGCEPALERLSDAIVRNELKIFLGKDT